MSYYDYLASGYDNLHGKEQLKKIKLILDEFNISNKKVLDIGCGTAFYSKFFKHYAGIDNSKEMLNKANANVILGNAEKLPFENKSFDVVISISAIHNFKDYKKAIDEMFRVAKESVIVSLFKRPKNFNEIKGYFKPDKEIDSDIDLIMFKAI